MRGECGLIWSVLYVYLACSVWMLLNLLHVSYLSSAVAQIIGADGSKSHVRKLSRIRWRAHSTIQYPSASLKLPRPPNQITLLAELSPLEDGQCASVKAFADGAVVGPTYPSFFVGGVVALFKRFYHGHCHVQLLLDHQLGPLVMDAWDRQGQLPWTVLLHALQVLPTAHCCPCKLPSTAAHCPHRAQTAAEQCFR